MTVTIFATSGFGVVGGVLCPGDVYVGEFDAEFVDCPPLGEDEDATCVTIDESGLTLKKLQQPDKGDEAGLFSLGNIVWTPVE